MDGEDDYVCADEEYDYSEPEVKKARGFEYGDDAKEVDLGEVEFDTEEILQLRDRLLRIGYTVNADGSWEVDGRYPEPVKCWEGFFSAKALNIPCTKEAYCALAGFKEVNYVPWFEEFLISQLIKVVRAVVTATLPTNDGGRSVRAYNGDADLVDSTWVDKPDAKTFALPITKRLAASAQVFCASAEIKPIEKVMNIPGYELPQTVTVPTLVKSNYDKSAKIDPMWKKEFLPLLQLPVKDHKKIVTPETVRTSPFIWSHIGKRYDGRLVATNNISSMSYYLFWVKDLYEIPACPINFKKLWDCPGPMIEKNLIQGVMNHSIWVGGFPTPGQAIIARMLDSGYMEGIAFCGSFSKKVVNFLTTTCELEGPNVGGGNPALEHGVKGIGSGDYADYSGVYWNPTVAHLPHLTGIKGIAVPYTSAKGCLSVVWDFIKTRCPRGCRVYATYGAFPALWVMNVEAGKHKLFKPSTSAITKLWNTCAWMSIVNFATSICTPFLSEKQKATDSFPKRLFWCCKLKPDGGPEFVRLDTDWVPGRWIDRVGAVDLNVPPDLWDAEDDGKPATGAGDGKKERKESRAKRARPDDLDADDMTD